MVDLFFYLWRGWKIGDHNSQTLLEPDLNTDQFLRVEERVQTQDPYMNGSEGSPLPFVRSPELFAAAGCFILVLRFQFSDYGGKAFNTPGHLTTACS